MTYLQTLLTEGEFAGRAHILEDLSADQARERPAGPLHSLYEELWHLDYWQRLMLAVIRGEEVVFPERALYSWPHDNEELTEEAWQSLVGQVLAGLQEATDLAGDAKGLSRDVRPGVSVRDRLESLLAHNAYHFGRMVLLRQMLGAWPPPSGGDTW